MAFIKFLSVYAVCAVALVLYQSDFAYAVSCYRCNSTSSNNNSKCDNNEVNATVVTNKCENATSCGTYTYKNSSDVYTVRDCNIDCATANKSLTVSSGWACNSCKEDLCNNVAINSTATTFGVGLVPILFTAIATFYCH